MITSPAIEFHRQAAPGPFLFWSPFTHTEHRPAVQPEGDATIIKECYLLDRFPLSVCHFNAQGFWQYIYLQAADPFPDWLTDLFKAE
jgi:hypothetical protein